MIIFWILAAGLVGLALLFAVLPLLRAAPADEAPGQDALNLEVFRQRLAELDSDLASGFLERSQYDDARHDLERELLYDLDGDPEGVGPSAAVKSSARPNGATRSPWLAAFLFLALPAGAVMAYLQLGDVGIVARMEAGATGAANDLPAGHPSTAGGGQAVPALDELVGQLAAKLEKNPDNLTGWLMLGRTYFAIGQPEKGLAAMERAFKLAPDDADTMIGYAEALAANNGNSLEGRPAELIRTALEAQPQNASARWLNGMLAYQQERFADAIQTWESILAELDAQGEEAQDMREMIAEARRRADLPSGAGGATAGGAPPGTGAAATPEPAQAAVQATPAPPAVAAAPTASETSVQPAGEAAIRVSVSLAPALAAQAAPEDTVFVFARASAGAPMPLAAQRIKVSDLPTTVTLDDSMAMVPAMRLSAFPQVLIGARISKSGEAMPQSGDLEGQTGPVDSAGKPEVSVAIDRVRP